MAEETEVGKVSTYFRKVGVTAVKVTAEIRKGDTLHFKGHTTDFACVAESMQVENEEVESARAGADLGIEVAERVREGDVVYKVTE